MPRPVVRAGCIRHTVGARARKWYEPVNVSDIDKRPADDVAPAPDGEFEAALLAFIADDVALEDGDIDGSTDLLLTGMVDSLGVVLIVEWIERTLGRTIDPADVVLENFQTVDSMMEFLRST
jgi:acyl carrier protein